MSLLTVKDLTLGYDSMVVVKDLNFTVNPGDYLCILGENGAGKSTLMKALIGLLKPISGTIERGDGLNPGELGFLPQQTLIQKDFPASVREIVLSGCLSKLGMRLGISDLKKRSFKYLSGGQQQRVLLARALCSTGKLLLLDEPVTGLDPMAQVELYELITKLNKEGTAIIMITHDAGSAMRYGSHILHIGDEIFFGKKEDYLESSVGRDFLKKGSDAEC